MFFPRTKVGDEWGTRGSAGGGAGSGSNASAGLHSLMLELIIAASTHRCEAIYSRYTFALIGVPSNNFLARSLTPTRLIGFIPHCLALLHAHTALTEETFGSDLHVVHQGGAEGRSAALLCALSRRQLLQQVCRD